MKNKSLLAIMLVLSVSLTGCATMFSGSTQRVRVKAVSSETHEAIPNAKCTLTTDTNTYSIDSNPGSVVLSKGQGALHINCKAKGYDQKNVGAGESFNAWTAANIVFWPGAIVDAATGAAEKYPSHITAVMEPVKQSKK